MMERREFLASVGSVGGVVALDRVQKSMDVCERLCSMGNRLCDSRCLTCICGSNTCKVGRNISYDKLLICSGAR